MQSVNRETAEKILCYLDENGWLFPQFALYKMQDGLQILGRGGFASVYEMINKARPQNHFALKVIGFEKHVVSSEHFRNTSRYQAILGQESDHVVRLLEVRELTVEADADGNVRKVTDSCTERWDDEKLHLQVMLMECLEEIIRKDKFKKAALTRPELSAEPEVIRLGMQIGGVLAQAHSYHILHRDVKLENIFWDARNDRYKLGDFGISKMVAEDGNTETVVYTDGYGAPEIERGTGGHYGAEADIYSLGITLYLLLNELRFPGSTGYYAKPEIQYHPEFIFPAPMHASQEMAKIIRKMCSYHVQDRYRSMAEVLMDLACAAKKQELDGADQYLRIAEIATETYREEQNAPADLEESDRPLTRAQRKEEQRQNEIGYRIDSAKYVLVLSALFVLLLKGMQRDAQMISKPLFWTLPIAVLMEAVFQHIKEMHIFWGVCVAVLIIFSIGTLGFTFPHLMLLLCCVSGVPQLSLSAACAVGIWIILERNGMLSFLDVLPRYHLGWLILAAALFVISRLFVMRIVSGKADWIGAYTQDDRRMDK